MGDWDGDADGDSDSEVEGDGVADADADSDADGDGAEGRNPGWIYSTWQGSFFCAAFFAGGEGKQNATSI